MGKGLLHYDGDEYEGNWNKMKSGEGVYRWKNGDKFEGTFYDDEFDGKGCCSWADGLKAEGEWLRGKMNGEFLLMKNGESCRVRMINDRL